MLCENEKGVKAGDATMNGSSLFPVETRFIALSDEMVTGLA
jgi:hypothetical protein